MKKLEHIFWGIFFLASAGFIIASQFGVFGEFTAQGGFWVCLLIVFFSATFIYSLIRLKFIGICFSAAFLAGILLPAFGITYISIWTLLLAALLLSIGLCIIFPKKKFRNHYKDRFQIKDDAYDKDGNIISDEAFSRTDETCETNESFRFENTFSSSIKYVISNGFTNGNIECTFGSMKVYFDNAHMKNKEAVVHIEASFCEVELYIPRSWEVKNYMKTALGGVNASVSAPNSEHTLILQGDCSFASVNVKYI